MDLWLALMLAFLALLFSSLKGIFIAYPLGLVLMAFVGLLWRRGIPLSHLLKLAFQGMRRAFPVLHVLLLIGLVMASWLAAGTVPALVSYGVRWIYPPTFLLMAFLLTSGVSVLMGTSFGTVGTIGVALMTLAQGSGLPSHWLAGAIIAGAYVGDRASPLSSSALLVATITHTRLYDNLRRMRQTGSVPFLISALIYGGLSWGHPIQGHNPILTQDLDQVFHIQPLLLLPALVLLLLSLLRVEVTRAMQGSLGVAIALALTVQQVAPLDLLQFLLLGFELDSHTALDSLFLGGGLLAMGRVSIVVLISTAFAGLCAVIPLPAPAPWLPWSRATPDRLLSTTLVGIGSAAFGCTQTLAILLTEQVMRPKYKESETGNASLALDLENTVVVISPLIPWNIAGLVPATLLNTDAGFIPFAVYLYLLPLACLLHQRLAASSKPQPCN